MLDLIVVDGRARGIVARDLVTGEIETHFADAVVLATGGYGNVFYLSTNAMGCNVTATWRAHRKGALLRQPLLHADPPDLHPGHGRPPVQAHADERVAAQRRPDLGAQGRAATTARPAGDPRGRARLLPRADLPGVRQPGAPRHRLARRPRTCATRAAASAPAGSGVYLDFADAIERLGRDGGRGEVRQPLRHVRPDHRRGPLRGRRCGSTPPCTTRWAACGSTTTCSRTIPGLFVTGEANFSDHGANRLGASRADAGPGRRLLRAAEHDPRLPRRRPVRRRSTTTTRRSSRRAGRRSRRGSSSCSSINGTRTVDSFHRELGKHHVGVLRHGAHRGGPAQGARPDPRAARGVLDATSRCSATGEQPQPVPGEGRPGRRLLRARRADVHRRAAPPRVAAAATSAPSPRPRTARRCATTRTSPTSPPGSGAGERRASRSCTRKT